jgi:DNA end-binding protein Ku
MQVVALIHHQGDAYGVSFPDFPGCTTVADNLESAVAKAGEVLAFHAEGLAEDGPLPHPRSLSELRSDPDFREDAKDAVLVLVSYEPPTRAVRINVTLEESLLARIDRSADAASETRSGYLAAAARLRMGMSGERSSSKSSRHSLRDDMAGAIGPGNQPHWKGYLKLSLISCPISLHPASTSEERVSFVQLNRKTGNRLKYQLVDSVTGQVVDLADRARGYEISKEEFLLVEDDEFAALIASTHTIEIEAFVPRAQVDPGYLISPYYITPDDEFGQQAFAVLREAMRGKNKKMVAIARVVLTTRERPIVLEPFGKGFRAITLRYPYEVRHEAESFANIPDIRVPNDMRQLAEHIIETMATDFDLSHYGDRYESALVEMLKRKQAGLPLAKAAAPPSNVINLMDALRRSVETERRPSARRSSRNERTGGSTK